MISTGIDALDQRLGGLMPGRWYVVSGAGGAGKTSVALHFLAAGLDAGEVCALLTQEDPGDLLAQAEFLGHDFRGPAERGQLVVLQYRLDFAYHYSRLSDPDAVVAELRALAGGRVPARLVIDPVEPFLAAGAAGLREVLERIPSTKYVVVQGERDAEAEAGAAAVLDGAAAHLRVRAVRGLVRELGLRKVRQAAASTEPFRFTLRPGLGIVPARDVFRAAARVPDEARRRVMLVDAGRALEGQLERALREVADVRAFPNVEHAIPELSGGDFGLLVLSVEGRAPSAAIALIRELRRAGIAAPIAVVSSATALRASTRARALRSGADAFFTDDGAVGDLVEQLEAVRAGRAPRRAEDAIDNALLQPTDDAGDPLLLDEDEMRRAVRHQIASASHPYFATVFLRPPHYVPGIARVLCEELRLREGDLVGEGGAGRLVLYLHDVGRREVQALLARIVARHPEFAMVEDVVIRCYPGDRVEVQRWIAEPDPLPGTAAD